MMKIIEDAASDVEHRKKAVELYKLVTSKIPTIDTTADLTLNLRDDDNKFVPVKFVGYEVTDLDLDAANIIGRNFLLGFSTSFGATHGMFSKFNKQIFSCEIGLLFFGLASLTDEDVRKYIGSLEFRRTFLHETIHMIDNIRTSYIKDSAKDFGEYINSPVEMNARYHDLVTNLTDLVEEIREISPEEVDDWLKFNDITGDFKADIKHILNSNHPNDRSFLKWLTADNRKRLLKRIFQLYSLLLKTKAEKEKESTNA